MLNKKWMAHGMTLWALLVLLFLGLACATAPDSPPGGPPAASADWPGISVTALPDELRSALNAGGVYVDATYPGGAADSAGVLQGDIITAVNDTPVSDPASFQA
ncbi:MAG: PDZ domain-containing protein, partial [Treponema sp.]|nr:PDZ domain-containing protein [Treponema sp.]